MAHTPAAPESPRFAPPSKFPDGEKWEFQDPTKALCQLMWALYMDICGNFNEWGYPKNGWFIIEHPTKMDDNWGYPYFMEHPHGPYNMVSSNLGSMAIGKLPDGTAPCWHRTAMVEAPYASAAAQLPQQIEGLRLPQGWILLVQLVRERRG